MTPYGLHAKHPVYPVFALVGSLLIFAFGLVSAKQLQCVWFLLGVYVWFLIFGYWRACVAVIPAAVFAIAVFSGVTYGITRDTGEIVAAVNRSAAICLGVIPGLSMPAVMFTRNLSQLKVPRALTLGMMIVMSFVPVLAREIKQIREAMRTRGAGSFLNPKVVYRAFLVPFVARLINISDTLALSVETRGFGTGRQDYTIYRRVNLTARDFVFIAGLLAGCILVVTL